MENLPELILPDLFRIEVPLPKNPLKAINSYVIKGEGRDLIIDTGMNRPECEAVLRDGLAALEVDLDYADFFITHLHADHVGLVATLASEDATVYFNQPDAASITHGIRWEAYLEYARRNGFPPDQLQPALQRHPGYRYTGQHGRGFHLVHDGDRLTVGDYNFVCVETPGHTKGHTCLYEPEKRLFFSGDHVLEDITPNISLFADGENPLRRYLDSLARIEELNVDLVLPGHRRTFRHLRERIAKLREHHHARAEEVLRLLGRERASAYVVATRMTWSLTYESWEDFPVSQKWFATGEAIAHLRYLEEEGRALREDTGDMIFYRRA